MTVDYDGVIIGGTVQAREVAALGARQGARLALVEPPTAVDQQIRRQLTVQILAQTGDASQQQNLFGPSQPLSPVHWQAVKQRVSLAKNVVYPHLTPETLAYSGVDMVLEVGHLSLKPRFAITTESRRLRGRRSLFSPPTQNTLPAIPGLAGHPVLTPATLLDLEVPPRDVVILGRSPDAIALAQALALLGVQTTLLTRGTELLPTEDPDISQFTGSLLRAAGVNLQLNAQIDSVQYDGTFAIDLTTGTRLKTSHILLGTALQPQTADLKLDQIGVIGQSSHIGVDDQLRTARSGCFAFGPCLGGYWADHLDHQDGAIALHNALYIPWRKLQQLSRVAYLSTVPEFARFGLTAQQALRGFGPAVTVMQISYEQVPRTHLDDRMTGFCRCIIHQDGSVLGAQIVGPNARDLTQTLALLAKRRIPIQLMAQKLALPMTYTELLDRISDGWQRTRWQPGQWRRDWAENWFNWRRSSYRN